MWNRDDHPEMDVAFGYTHLRRRELLPTAVCADRSSDVGVAYETKESGETVLPLRAMWIPTLSQFGEPGS